MGLLGEQSEPAAVYIEERGERTFHPLGSIDVQGVIALTGVDVGEISDDIHATEGGPPRRV